MYTRQCGIRVYNLSVKIKIMLRTNYNNNLCRCASAKRALWTNLSRQTLLNHTVHNEHSVEYNIYNIYKYLCH